jgi:hypothetical protein
METVSTGTRSRPPEYASADGPELDTTLASQDLGSSGHRATNAAADASPICASLLSIAILRPLQSESYWDNGLWKGPMARAKTALHHQTRSGSSTALSLGKEQARALKATLRRESCEAAAANPWHWLASATAFLWER